jgi:hypothetical protein
MTSITSAQLAQKIANAVSGDRGLNAPIFPDDLVSDQMILTQIT